MITAPTMLLLGLLVSDCAGYWLHRLAHWRRGGAVYRAHMAHHEVLYGREFLSDAYRDPPASGSSVLAFLPFVLGLAALFVLVAPAPLGAALALECLGLAWLNSYIHDGLHVRRFWLARFRWFRRLRRLHRQHHLDMSTNFGIFTWLWDRAFRTFRDPAAKRVDLGPHAPVPTGDMRKEFLVAVSVLPGGGQPGRIELCAILAEDEAAALAACTDASRGINARHAVPLEGDVLALWNELGKAAFGFGC